MCGRGAFLRTVAYPTDLLYDLMEAGWSWEEALALYLKLEKVDLEWPVPRYNMSPGNRVPTIVERDGVQRLVDTHWGVPLEVEGGERLVFNAQRERLLESPAWRSSLGKRHGVQVFTGYYEWRNKRREDPVFLYAKQPQPLFLPCLLYEATIRDKPRLCAVTVTKEPTPMTAQVHDRMPVILDGRDKVDWWLRDAKRDPERAVRDLAWPLPDDRLAMMPINTRVNDTTHEGPDILVARRTLDSFGF